jgi:putative multiple sugar transport system permease protein
MSIIRENIRQYAIFSALIIVAVAFQFLTNGVVFLPTNITNLFLQNGDILILAIGMTMVIVTGRIDLSVGSIMGVSGAIAGVLIISQRWPVWLVILIVLTTGFLIGAFQGYWIAYRKIPFFVVTLSGMMMYRGLTMLILDGRMLSPFPTSFQMMSAGFVPDFVSDIVGGSDINLTAVFICALIAILIIIANIRNRRISNKYGVEKLPIAFFVIKLIFVTGIFGLFAYWFGASNGIPNVLVVLSILVLIYSYIANKTILGRHIYATGSNAKASELSGIKTKKIVFWVYVNMAVLASLAGMVFAARLNAANPRVGEGAELQAIAAAFIGGASPAGGVGKVSGAIAGAMLVGIMNNGMSIMGVSISDRQVVTGFLLLAAVIFDVLMKNRAERNIKGPIRNKSQKVEA